jgi:hypothetical protein
VVFEKPADDTTPGTTDLVKQAIGLPGETISARDGQVYIDGRYLSQPWLPKVDHGVTVLPSSIPGCLPSPPPLPGPRSDAAKHHTLIVPGSRFWLAGCSIESLTTEMTTDLGRWIACLLLSKSARVTCPRRNIGPRPDGPDPQAGHWFREVWVALLPIMVWLGRVNINSSGDLGCAHKVIGVNEAAHGSRVRERGSTFRLCCPSIVGWSVLLCGE